MGDFKNMNFKKTLLVFCLIICILFSISGVVASANDTATASEDANQIIEEDILGAGEASDNTSHDSMSKTDLDDDSISAKSDENAIGAEDNNSSLNAQENNIISTQKAEQISTSGQYVDYSEFTILNPLENGVYKVGDEITASIKPNKFVYSYNSENHVVLYYYVNGKPYWQEYDSFVYTKSDIGNTLERYGSFTLTEPGKFTVKVEFQNDYVGEYTFTVKKGDTKLSASKVTATYGVSKKLVATLKEGNGNGYSLSSKKVTVKVGSITKTSKTNDKGQVSLDVSSLAPKTYTATIIFAGDSTHVKSSAKVKVTVKKATPKLTAKAKAFKKSVKTKKYSITLKTNQNKVMKNTKVTLKVNGKTYSAKTNAKGQATFKITKLTMKGTFTAVVKFAGNKYYNAKTVKPKITIK